MRKRGSITVFLALTLASVMMLFFLLLDLARIYGQRQKADVISDIASQSVFADYNRYLWENYRILAVDASYGNGGGADFSMMEARMQEYLLKNGISPDTRGTDLYKLLTEKCEVAKYGFITDQDGRAFLKQAALQQKSELAVNVVERMVDRNDQVNRTTEESEDVEQLMEDGSDAFRQSGELIEKSDETNTEVDLEGAREAEEEVNPIEQLAEWRDNGILAQVLPESAGISDRSIDLSDAVSKRALASGNGESVTALSAAEKALFADYEKTHFSNYRQNRRHAGLKYEWEYVLCGKSTDKANLAATVTRLLASREAENLASLMADEGKVAQADAHAMALAGWTGNAAIINAVFWGLIASWVYMESVLDVRLLLDGGKVSLIKSPAEWTTTNLLELASWFEVSRKAKDCGHGLTYEDFLLTLSALQSQKTLGLRSLDLLENSLRMQRYYQNVSLDQFLVSAEFSYEYKSAPAFFSLFALSDQKFPILQIKRIRKMSYMDKD